MHLGIFIRRRCFHGSFRIAFCPDSRMIPKWPESRDVKGQKPKKWWLHVTSALKPIGLWRSKGSKGLHSFHPKIQQIQRTQMLQMMVTWYKDLLPSCVGEVSFVAICCRQGWSHRWSAHLILLPTKTVVVTSLWHIKLQRLPWAKEKGTTKQKQYQTNYNLYGQICWMGDRISPG